MRYRETGGQGNLRIALSLPRSAESLRRLLLNHIVAKDESEFRHRPGLTLEVATLAEGQTRRYVAHVNIGKVATEVKASVLEGGSHRDRRALAASTVHQVHHSRIRPAPRAADIFPAY